MSRGTLTPHNRRIYTQICFGCGRTFNTARPEAYAHDNRCRSALRRFRKLWGCNPIIPLRDCQVSPGWIHRKEWFGLFLPPEHPKNAPPPPPVQPKPKKASTTRSKPKKKTTPKRKRAAAGR